MLDEAELGDIFGGVQTLVNQDDILLAVNTSSGTVNVPEGLDKYDMLYASLYFTSEPTTVRGTDTIEKDLITIGDVWQLNASDASTTIRCNITFTDNNTLTISGAVNGGIAFIKGIRTRKVSETTTVTLAVNNGNPIGVSYREKIPASMLPASMLDDAGKIKDSVSVRVVIDYDGSVGGDAGEGEAGWIYSGPATGSYGVKALLLNKQFINVQSGNLSLMATAISSGNPFGSTSNLPAGATATSRVIVTNTERFAKPIA